MIVIGTVSETVGHPPAAGIVLTTVSVPGVLEIKSIIPVEGSINKVGEVELKSPATPPPVNVGVAVPTL